MSPFKPVGIDETSNLPARARQRIADNLADPATVEGSALSATTASGTADPSAALLDLTSKVLNNACRHLLTTWLPTAHPGTGQITLSGVNESNVRPPSGAAVALAVAIATARFDPATAGTSESDATVQAVRLISSLAAQHKSTAGGSGWGGATRNTVPPTTGNGNTPDWQAGLWAMNVSVAAHLLWEELSGPQRVQVQDMLTYEADRLLQWVPPFWKTREGVETFPGDSKSEEIVWSESVLVAALVMLPSHPNAPAWRSKLVEAGVAAYAVPADLTDTTPVNGLVPAVTLDGTNMLPDGVIRNHGIVHPDYFCSASSLLGLTMGLADLSGVTLPVAVDRNIPIVYSALSEVIFDPPTYAAPGGSVYPWPAVGAIYYPQGSSWSAARVIDKASMDVVAHAYGWDRGLAYPAARAAVLHLNRQLALQARHADGRTYTPEEASEGGSEQNEAAAAAAALLALVGATTRARTHDAVYDPEWESWSAAVGQLAPELWWRLNETSGDVFADASGNDRPGTRAGGSGLTYGAESLVPSDTADAALAFGAPGAIIVRAHETWMKSTSFTVALTVKSAAPIAQEQILAGVTETPGGLARLWQIGLRPTTGALFAAIFDNATPTGSVQLATAGSITDGDAHLIVLAVDESSARLYVDGVLAESKAAAPSPAATAYLCVGARRTAGSPTVPGIPTTAATLDDLACFSYAMDAETITRLHTAWAATP